MLADKDIRLARSNGHIGIEPFDDAALQPASYDLTLDRHFLVPNPEVTVIDMADVQAGHMLPMVASNEGFVLEPGDFVLGSSKETVTVGGRFLGRVEGKSSIGRLGILVHVTAGFIDPGFHGQVTLEIVNVAPWEIVLYPGQRIAQIAFSRMSAWPERVYGAAGNHYMNQSGPTESRFQIGALPVESSADAGIAPASEGEAWSSSESSSR